MTQKVTVTETAHVSVKDRPSAKKKRDRFTSYEVEIVDDEVACVECGWSVEDMLGSPDAHRMHHAWRDEFGRPS